MAKFEQDNPNFTKIFVFCLTRLLKLYQANNLHQYRTTTNFLLFHLVSMLLLFLYPHLESLNYLTSFLKKVDVAVHIVNQMSIFQTRQTLNLVLVLRTHTMISCGQSLFIVVINLAKISDDFQANNLVNSFL